MSKHAMKKFDDIMMGSEVLKSKEAFSVPEGYFENFNAKISSRIQAQESRKRSTGFVPFYAAAAAIAVLIGLALTFSSISRQSSISDDSLCESDYLFYSAELIPATDPDYIYYSFEDSESISAEDIVNYLDYIGAEVENYINE